MSLIQRSQAALTQTLLCLLLVIASAFAPAPARAQAATDQKHLLYVGVPGIRDELQYGGHGVLVFDIDNGHRFVRRIAAGGLTKAGKPMNVKGICASAATGRLYISTLQAVTCFDLGTDKIIWEKKYEGGCDRLAISPDGKMIYLPSLEGAHWLVLDAISGEVTAKIVPNSGAHNTIFGQNGREVYLAGLRSNLLTISDPATQKAIRTCGPFSNFIRPYTVNGRQTLCFVNVNELLGFEVGDLVTGKMLYRVQVEGFKKGPTKRHGCPSHGIGLTPDEKEIWLCDAFNSRLHIFDASANPPKQVESIALRDQPGWVTFSIDGRYAYPSTGDVVDVKTHKIVTTLKDETGAEVQSEKLLEIDFANGQCVRAGDQFGLGRVTGNER